MPRKLAVAALLLLLLVLTGGLVLPALASTDAFRAKVLGLLERATDRRVSADRVRIAPFFRSVRLEGFSLANPPGFPAGNTIAADRLRLDVDLRALLRGRIDGTLEGRGLMLEVMRRGDATNLDGLAGRESEDPVPMDLGIEFAGARVVVADLDTGHRVTVEGIGLQTRISDLPGAYQPVSLTIESIERGAFRLEEIGIEAASSGEEWNVQRLVASFPDGGTLSGNGRMRVDGGWALELDAEDVDLDGDLYPVGAALFPLAAGTRAPGGTLDGSFSLRADGATWERVRQTLGGTGTVSATGLELPASAVAAQVAKLAGVSPKDVRAGGGQSSFRIEDGWIRFDRVEGRIGELPLSLEGRVALDGRLDLTTDLLPLVRRIDAGPFQQVAGRVDRLPIKIRGSPTAPRVEPPRPAELIDRSAREVLKDVLPKILP